MVPIFFPIKAATPYFLQDIFYRFGMMSISQKFSFSLILVEQQSRFLPNPIFEITHFIPHQYKTFKKYQAATSNFSWAPSYLSSRQESFIFKKKKNIFLFFSVFKTFFIFFVFFMFFYICVVTQVVRSSGSSLVSI